MNFKIKGVSFFYFPKQVFDIKNSKTNVLGGFSSVFAFKQAKEHILFQMIPLKMCFFEIVLILGYNLKIFKGPDLHPKGMKFWNWSPTTIWHNIKCVAFYFSKSLHPTVYGDIDDLGEHM